MKREADSSQVRQVYEREVKMFKEIGGERALLDDWLGLGYSERTG